MRVSWIASALVLASGCAGAPARTTTPVVGETAAAAAAGRASAASSPPASPPPAAPAVAPASEPAPARRAALFYELNGRTSPAPLVRGTAAGQPVVLLLDTGASHHILAASFVRRAGIATVAAEGRVHGHAAGSVGLSRAPHAALAIEGWGGLGAAGESLPVVEIPGSIDQLGVGGFVSPQGLGAPGAEAVVLALPEGELRAVPRGALPEALARPLEGVHRCGDPARGGALFLARATIDGEPFELLVDTGARSTAVYGNGRAAQRLAPRAVPTGITAQTVSGPLPVTMVRGARVAIAGRAVPSDVAVLPVAAQSPLPGCNFDGVLGMDLLRACTLVFADGELRGTCHAN